MNSNEIERKNKTNENDTARKIKASGSIQIGQILDFNVIVIALVVGFLLFSFRFRA